jgi:hypothetical protein
MYFAGDNLAYMPDQDGKDVIPDQNPNDRRIHYDLKW